MSFGTIPMTFCVSNTQKNLGLLNSLKNACKNLRFEFGLNKYQKFINRNNIKV